MRNITWTYILHSFIFLFKPFRLLMMLRRVAVDLAFLIAMVISGSTGSFLIDGIKLKNIFAELMGDWTTLGCNRGLAVIHRR